MFGTPGAKTSGAGSDSSILLWQPKQGEEGTGTMYNARYNLNMNTPQHRCNPQHPAPDVKRTETAGHTEITKRPTGDTTYIHLSSHSAVSTYADASRQCNHRFQALKGSQLAECCVSRARSSANTSLCPKLACFTHSEVTDLDSRWKESTLTGTGLPRSYAPLMSHGALAGLAS